MPIAISGVKATVDFNNVIKFLRPIALFGLEVVFQVCARDVVGALIGDIQFQLSSGVPNKAVGIVCAIPHREYLKQRLLLENVTLRARSALSLVVRFDDPRYSAVAGGIGLVLWRNFKLYKAFLNFKY